MPYIKAILLLILMMMDRCGILPRKLQKKTPASAENLTKESPTDINGTWRLSASGQADSLQPQALVKEAILLSFFPDSSFTELNASGRYDIGKWRFTAADSSLVLIYKNKKEDFKVSPSRDFNGLRWINLSSSTENLAFGGFGKSMENYREDPFYKTNNLWRSKPSQAETKLQIRDRLVAYLGHSRLLMQAALTRRQQVISWEFSRGILKIYRSGIGVVPEEEIPDQWFAYFYSQEEAILAHTMLKEYLLTTSYKGSATGNWLKDDCDILTTIYQGLKMRKEADLI